METPPLPSLRCRPMELLRTGRSRPRSENSMPSPSPLPPMDPPSQERRRQPMALQRPDLLSGGAITRWEKQSQSLEVTEPVPGTPSDPQSGTPIPDKKVLELILDKLQKKDTYGVFSEPVDPKELPDYHDIIQNPMDFGTIRKKLAKGVYPDLEHFEKDVFLICTNAMRYNASETVYYRQARSIQELARKNFQSLRLDPEGFEVELKPASKGKSNYSSKKWTKKPGLRRYPLEPAGSDFSSGATLATGGDHTKLSNASLHDSTKIRKVVASERPGNVYGYSSWK